MPRRHIIVNALAFQAAWFASVLAVREGHAGLCWLFSLATLLLYAWITACRRGPLLFVLLCAVPGWIGDLVLIQFNVFAAQSWPPLWLLAFWLNFATLPAISLRWLDGRPLLAGALGAVGGPLSYASAARLGAITLPSNEGRSLLIMAIIWALWMPLFIRLSRLSVSNS